MGQIRTTEMLRQKNKVMSPPPLLSVVTVDSTFKLNDFSLELILQKIKLVKIKKFNWIKQKFDFLK